MFEDHFQYISLCHISNRYENIITFPSKTKVTSREIVTLVLTPPPFVAKDLTPPFVAKNFVSIYNMELTQTLKVLVVLTEHLFIKFVFFNCFDL